MFFCFLCWFLLVPVFPCYFPFVFLLIFCLCSVCFVPSKGLFKGNSCVFKGRWEGRKPFKRPFENMFFEGSEADQNTFERKSTFCLLKTFVKEKRFLKGTKKKQVVCVKGLCKGLSTSKGPFKTIWHQQRNNSRSHDHDRPNTTNGRDSNQSRGRANAAKQRQQQQANHDNKLEPTKSKLFLQTTTSCIPTPPQRNTYIWECAIKMGQILFIAMPLPHGDFQLPWRSLLALFSLLLC